MEPRFVDPFTDFGFKKLFGEEPNKELLQDFLNELLADREGRIVELTYLKNEQLDGSANDRKAFFDLYCKNERGERFIVELQKSKQQYFRDRTIFYSTFPIRDQSVRAKDWDYELKAIYVIAIMDFKFDEGQEDKEKFRYDVQLMDIATKKVFYDKLTYIYLEMPKFDKAVEELTSRYEKWLYVIKNLGRLEDKPIQLQERIFSQLFDAAEVASYDLKQRLQYNETLKILRDNKNVMDYAMEQALEQGLEQGLEKGLERGQEKGRRDKTVEAIIQGHNLGVSVDVLARQMNLSEKEVQRIVDQQA